jgi:hypothetical protein
MSGFCSRCTRFCSQSVYLLSWICSAFPQSFHLNSLYYNKIGYYYFCSFDTAWFKTGIWRLRGMRKGSEKGRWPLCSEEEDPIHILLKCSETRKWREQFLSRKWLRLNEWIVFKKIINCNNIIELRNIGSYLYKIKFKWENKIRNLSSEWGSRTVVISYLR